MSLRLRRLCHPNIAIYHYDIKQDKIIKKNLNEEGIARHVSYLLKTCTLGQIIACQKKNMVLSNRLSQPKVSQENAEFVSEIYPDPI